MTTVKAVSVPAAALADWEKVRTYLAGSMSAFIVDCVRDKAWEIDGLSDSPEKIAADMARIADRLRRLDLTS